MSSAVGSLLARFWRPTLRFFLLLLVGVGIVVSGCTTVTPVVKIGLVAPFDGRNRPVGYDVIYSARLAIRQVNEAGGIGPYRVALVSLDDSGEPELAMETAAALVADPAVVTVVGHWLPETTRVAADVYADGGLPFVPAGDGRFGVFDEVRLPESFQKAYNAITPFDETPGPYAGSAYDAINMILAAMSVAQKEHGAISRTTMTSALDTITYEGITGILPAQ